GDIAQEVVNLFHVHVLAQLQVQHSHGYIRGGNANRVAGELAFEFWQCLGDSLRSTGLGEHHVQPGSAATAVALVVVVNEVLVIGKRVRGLHMAMYYAVAVIDDLEHRGNTIGGTGCRRQDGILGRHVLVVDAVDNVVHIALTWCGQQYVGNALGFQVLAQSLAVAPHAGVIHQHGVVDAVRSVVNISRVVGVDHLDLGAISPDDFVFFIHFDGAVECAMDGIAAQQGSTLVNVLITLLAHDDSAQTDTTIGSLAGNKNACEQAADAAKAVEHNITGFVLRGGANYFLQLLFQVGAQVIGLRSAEAFRQAAHINRGGAKVHIHQ